MADYTLQLPGATIDQRLAEIPNKQDALVSGTNIKTINNESILGSGNIIAGDPNAVKYVSQTLTDAQKAQARANIAAASASELGQIVTDLNGIEADIGSLEAAVQAINVGDYVTATTLPTASASTMGHIYLIGPDANDNYDRYFTQESGGSYSWVSLGSTQIDLSDYATNEELSQLEAKVDGFDEITLAQSDFTIANGLIRSDGVFAQASSVHGRYGLTLIPSDAKKVEITANSTGATYYAFLTSNNLINGEQAPFVSGTALSTVSSGTSTGEVDVPDGAKYLYIYVSTSDTGTLERFPEEIKLYGTGTGLIGRVSDLESNLEKTIENQFVRVVNADTYMGETHFGYIGLDGNFNSSVSNQYIVLSLSGFKMVNVRANSSGATYFAFLTSSTLTANQQAPFAKKCNLVNLSTGQSSGILDVPIDAEYLYVFISIQSYNIERFPYVNLFREHILVDNPFAVIDNDFSDTSLFTGLDSTRISADGYSPATGFSNKVTINRLVTADEYTLSYFIKLSNLSSVFCLSSVSSGLSSRSSIVTFDFGTGKIEFHNPSDNGSSMTVVKSSKNIDSVTGNLYRCEVGRRERNVFAAVTNLTTGIRTEYMPTDTSNKGTDYGWFYDGPAFSLISGSCTISRIVETMPTRPFMLFLGDSITAGYGVSYEDCWAKKACVHFGGNSFISARSNGTITEMMKKVIEEVPKICPKFVVLTIGTNGGNTLQNLSQIRDLIKGFGAIPIINCIYQRSGTSHIATDDAVNDIILSLGCLCSRFDLATSLNNTISSGGNPAYYQSDGLHLNADGNDAVYDRFVSDMSIIYTE